MSKNYFVYPAVIHFWTDEDGQQQTSVTFPDLPGLVTGPGPGASFEEVLEASKEGLALHLEGMIEDGHNIPEPTPIDRLEYDKRPKEGGSVTLALVDVVLPVYRNRKTEYARINVTIPKWLKELAEEKKINFSKVLREGLYDVLNLESLRDKDE
ncbi:MAG: type II toxin-antitoxin system HicB family antitoxin [Firmicutes bacterium]|nr:type II toxin-antitoxin system HicB family antitoxin [Bacillota bacterium]